MRLGQLARQLEIKPEKIVSFLEKEKNIIVKTHPNSKVEDDLIDLITNKFKPVIVEDSSTEIIGESIVEKVAEHSEPEHIETVKPGVKQELKIIGKIDLPNKAEINVEVDGVVYDQATIDTKKKEDLKIERERKEIEKEEKRKADEERKAKAKEQRMIEAERKAMLETEKNNILTKEEEKKKAAILKAQKDREEKLEAKRKLRQAEHYSNQIGAKIPAKKKKKEPLAKVINKPKSAVEKPKVTHEVKSSPEIKEKSPLKRFIKWLNT